MTCPLVIAGPTASGKSRLALRVAERVNGTVINADSMQLYRELQILTARPHDGDLARAPHALYGILSAAESCSAARWRAMALDAIAEARVAGRLPILVGGTGLYLRALLEGLADIPPVPPAIRESVRARWESLGPRAFHAEVARVDPVLGLRLAMRDRQRLMRALEVYEATGRPLSEWQKSPMAMPGMEARVIVLDPPREAHKAACDARFLHMVEQGALDEVRALVALGLDPDLPAMKALGVRELTSHTAGSLSLESAIAAAQRATRAYAKRQRTWFRHQLAAEAVFESPEAAEAALLQRGITGGR